MAQTEQNNACLTGETTMTDTHAATGYPPLPDPLPDNARRDASGKRLIDDGCYYLAYSWHDTATYEGTLRIDSSASPLFASGDLYNLDPAGRDADAQMMGAVPPPAPGLPIFAIGAYRHYLRVMQIEPFGPGFVITFQAHRFVPRVVETLDGIFSLHWVNEGLLVALMMPADAPAGYPKPGMFFRGNVSRDGAQIGRMQMGWVAPILRRATIEIDRVQGTPAPLNNGAGVSWNSIFDPIGWDVKVIESNSDVTKSEPGPWTPADARKVLRERRDSDDLDSEWRYHILVVPLMIRAGSPFGFMFDRDEKAREALYMSSDFEFPATEPRWGSLRGQRSRDTVAFFRTAVHEMGHAMGLDHNTGAGDFFFMRPTEGIADTAPASQPFPTNISWSFHPNDIHQLRHWPDIIVRPGGIDMNSPGTPLSGA
jgi:hypothetical protein